MLQMGREKLEDDEKINRELEGPQKDLQHTQRGFSRWKNGDKEMEEQGEIIRFFFALGKLTDTVDAWAFYHFMGLER